METIMFILLIKMLYIFYNTFIGIIIILLKNAVHYIINKELRPPSNKWDNSHWWPYPCFIFMQAMSMIPYMCHPGFLHCDAAISWGLALSSQTVTICTDKTLIFACWFQAVCIQLIQYYFLLKHKQLYHHRMWAFESLTTWKTWKITTGSALSPH